LERLFRGGALAIALLAMCLSGGCTSVSSTNLIDEVRNADLSAKHPKPAKGSAIPGSKRQSEIFPGDDSVFEGPAARSASKGRSKQVSIQKVSNPASNRAGDGYQLNFDGANLAEVAKVVLGDTLKLPYHHDPRVQGQITLSTARPVSSDELLSVLESALKIHNAVLIKAEGGYRIALAADAMTGDTGGVLQAKGEPLVPGFGVSVLPLRHISAEAVMRLLENFVSKGGMLRAETTGNLLLVRGTATDRQSIMEVATTFDTDWLKGQSAGIFSLNHTTPDELIGDLTGAMKAEQGDLLGKMIRFQPLHRLNAVLVLAHQSNQLQQAAEWIRRLDRSSEAGESLHVYRVQNGRARDLAALLNETLGTGGASSRKAPQKSEVAPGRDIVALTTKGKQPPSGPLLAAAATAGAKKPADPPSPAINEVPQPGGKLAQSPTPDVRISADEVNNLLLILARASDYRRIATVLRQIDRPPLQVMINATIVEVTLNDSLRFGVQVFLKSKNTSGGFVNAAEIPLAPSVPGLNFIAGSLADPKVVVDALADVTEVKIVSSPSVVVVDNQPAVL
jgi:general secretion pathway protein D